MSVPIRIQRKRSKGFRLKDEATNGLPVVCVNRPSKYGNPFPLSKFSPEESLKRFRAYLEAVLLNNPFWLTQLRKKNLACFCPVPGPCHAEILIEISNSPAQIEREVKAQSLEIGRLELRQLELIERQREMSIEDCNGPEGARVDKELDDIGARIEQICVSQVRNINELPIERQRIVEAEIRDRDEEI